MPEHILAIFLGIIMIAAFVGSVAGISIWNRYLNPPEDDFRSA